MALFQQVGSEHVECKGCHQLRREQLNNGSSPRWKWKKSPSCDSHRTDIRNKYELNLTNIVLLM